MQIFSDLVMKSSTIILSANDNFPTSPQVGQFCFKDGVLYLYATLESTTTWYPLTNQTLYYVHTQTSTSTAWDIEHSLNTNDLIVMVYDENDVVQLGSEIEFVDLNNITISFTELMQGRAVIFAATNTYGAMGGGSGGGDMNNPMTALGDLIYGSDASGTPGRLAKGASNMKLFMDLAGNIPIWGNGVYVGQFTRDMAAAPGSVNYTGIGFRPSALFTIFVVQATSIFGLNLVTNPTGAWDAGKGVHQSAGNYLWYNTPLIDLYPAGGRCYGYVSAFIDDGFSIQWNKTNNPTGTVTGYYLAIR